MQDRLKNLDEIDFRILKILQTTGRSSLTSIADDVKLSVDSVKKRLAKLEEKGVIQGYTAVLNPLALDLTLRSEIRVKLHNVHKQEYDKLVADLAKHPSVHHLRTLMGSWDLSFDILGKDAADIEAISLTIRQKFHSLIAEWEGAIVMNTHKGEQYKL